MELQSAIEGRRSIRKYDTDKKVTKEQLLTLIQAAQQAPSWKNSQTARYYCILSKEMEEKFRQQCLPASNEEKSRGAALVVTTFVRNHSGFDVADGVAVNECENGWGFYDLGLQNQNFMLKAHEMGLGTLVMGIRNGEEIRQLLHIPEKEEVVAVLAVGYPATQPATPPRKATEEIVKFC